MNKHRRTLSILLVLVLTLISFAGCSGSQDEDSSQEVDDESQGSSETGSQTDSIAFFPSDGIDDNGYWKGITALDHLELFDYQNMVIPAATHTIPDETVQGEMEGALANYRSNREVLDRAVADGDTVNIDYVGSVDGVEFDGGSTGGAGTDVTIGVTSYIDDFLEQLIGHSPGETVNVEVTFPDDYHAQELQSKDALFVTEINHIVETVTPELNDDFVAENFLVSYGWSTVDDMREGISSQMQQSAILSYTQDYMMDNTTFLTMPDELVTYMEASMISYFQEMANSYGVELEEILAVNAGVASVEELIEANHESNVKQANYYLAIQAVAEEAGITASEADVAAYFADQVGTDDYSPYEEAYGMPYLKQITLNQLVLDYLMGLAELE